MMYCNQNQPSRNNRIVVHDPKKKGFFKSFKRNLTSTLSLVKRRIVGAIATAFVMSVYCQSYVLAAGTGDTSSITAPLTSLKTLVVAIIGAVGVIILAKNVMEFAQAYQQQDSSTMNSALKGIVAGIMMAGISTVLSFLGY